MCWPELHNVYIFFTSKSYFISTNGIMPTIGGRGTADLVASSYGCSPTRYVGAIWFFFSYSSTYADWIYTMKLVLHQQIYSETYAYKWKELEKWNLRWSSYRYQLPMFVDFLTRYVNPSNCAQSLLNMCSLWCLLLDPYQTKYQSNIKVWLRKVTA